MNLVILYLKLLGNLLWMFFCCVVGLVMCIFRWGDPRLSRDFARFYSWGTLKISGLRVEIRGQEILDAGRPAVLVANHQSALDMATFGALYPENTVLIGKKEIRWIPLFGLFYMASGNLMIDRKKSRSAIGVLKEAVDEIKRRQASVWIFPEGTRNRLGEGMLPFKKGAFHMAIQGQVPVIPIVSSTLTPIVSWQKKHFSSGRVILQVLQPISTQGMVMADVDRLSDQVRSRMIEALRSLS